MFSWNRIKNITKSFMGGERQRGEEDVPQNKWCVIWSTISHLFTFFRRVAFCTFSAALWVIGRSPMFTWICSLVWLCSARTYSHAVSKSSTFSRHHRSATDLHLHQTMLCQRFLKHLKTNFTSSLQYEDTIHKRLLMWFKLLLAHAWSNSDCGLMSLTLLSGLYSSVWMPFFGLWAYRLRISEEE